jgi:putative flippase GtrA
MREPSLEQTTETGAGENERVAPGFETLRAEVRRLGRYILAGGSMALLSAALLWLFTSVSDLPAGVLAVAAGLIVAPATYLLHRYYTFKSDNAVPFEAAGFLGIVLMNYPLSILIVFVSVDLLGLHPFAGGLLAALIPPGVNYVLHTRVVFSQRRAH